MNILSKVTERYKKHYRLIISIIVTVLLCVVSLVYVQTSFIKEVTDFFSHKEVTQTFPEKVNVKKGNLGSKDSLATYPPSSSPNAEEKTYNTTKFCVLDNATSSKGKGWEGVWFTKDSNYFHQSSLRICTNTDKSLHFFIASVNSLSLAGVEGVAQVISQEGAEGVVFDGEDSKETKRTLNCRVLLTRSSSTIKTVVSGSECNLYSGVHSSISSQEYRNDVDVETVPSLRNVTADIQQFSGNRSDIKNEEYVFGEGEYDEFERVAGSSVGDFSKYFEGLYLISVDKDKTRVYRGGSWRDTRGMIMIGGNNKVWAIIHMYDKKENVDTVKYFTNVKEDAGKLPTPFSEWLPKFGYPYDGSEPFKGKVLYMSK